MKVVLADYGAGNLRSVCSALSRAGLEPSISVDPEVVGRAPLAVIAGVGHLERAKRGLEAHGLDEALRERASDGRPILGICVGLQLLFDESDEGGRGLGLLAGRVRRIEARCVPHMGWNSLDVRRESALLGGLETEDVYFAHSYAVEPADRGVVTAAVDHDGPIVAAVESGALAGVQFHPERSGAAGARLLANAADWARGR